MPKDFSSLYQDNPKLAELKEIFIKNGSNEERLNAQLKELDEIIILSTTKRLLNQKPPSHKFANETEVSAYIQSNFAQEEVGEVLGEESRRVASEYMQALSAK